MNDCQTNPVGWWRLALLVKNMVILGSALDPRAAAIDASASHGIIGTHDGLVYMWELSTGTKLGSLHYFKVDSDWRRAWGNSGLCWRRVEAVVIILSRSLYPHFFPPGSFFNMLSYTQQLGHSRFQCKVLHPFPFFSFLILINDCFPMVIERHVWGVLNRVVCFYDGWGL